MAQVVVYSKTYCPYCDRAKSLLKNKNVTFEEINLEGKDDDMRALVARTGMRTVPQIFIDGKLVGGFTDLAALEEKGELDTLLATSA